jgi:hypothetical protein
MVLLAAATPPIFKTLASVIPSPTTFVSGDIDVMLGAEMLEFFVLVLLEKFPVRRKTHLRSFRAWEFPSLGRKRLKRAK